MAHELYIENNTASMAYVGAAPWHGLGQKLEENATLEVWAEQAGMTFEIHRTTAEFAAPSGMMIVPGRDVLYRSDTEKPLAVVSSRYQVVQPKQVLEFFRDLTEQYGYTLETAGVLFAGQKYWALAKTPHQVTLGGDDIIKAHLLLATSCDGTMSTIARYVQTRVVCNNTIEMALAENGGQVRVSHKTKFSDVRVKQELSLLEESWEQESKKLENLSKRSVSNQEAIDYFIKVLGDPSQDIEHQRNVALLAKVHALFDGSGIGASMESYKGTAWGLVNAVTEYVDHYRGSKDDSLAKDRRVESAWFYDGAKIKQRAMNDALALVAA